jgi:hypothetical protein
MELEEEGEEEIDDGYYENNDLYIYEIHYEDQYYEDEYGYEDSDQDEYNEYNDGRYTQYELLFKDAQRCGWDDVNPESEEILRDFVFEYIKTNKDVMFFIESDFIRNDIDIIKYLIRKQAFFIQHASREIQDNYEIGLYCVTKSSTTLEYLSANLKDNYDIVYASIKKYNKSLCFASNRLKNDKTLLSICLNDRFFYFFRQSYSEDYIINNLPIIYYFMIKKNRNIGKLLRYYSDNFMDKVITQMKILKYLYVFDNVYIDTDSYSIRESLYDELDIFVNDLLEYM